MIQRLMPWMLALGMIVPIGFIGPAASAQTATSAPGAATSAPARPTTSIPSAEDRGLVSGIPLPNSGAKPQASGDRGGWAQLTLLGLIVAGVSFIMWRVVRSARALARARDA